MTTEYLVTDLDTGTSHWVRASSAADAVLLYEAKASGQTRRGLKPSHHSSGDMINVRCGRAACRGIKERVFRDRTS